MSSCFRDVGAPIEFRSVRRLSFALGLIACMAAARAAPPRQIATLTTLSATVAGTVVTSVSAGTAVTLTANVTTSAAVPVSPGQVIFCDAAGPCTDIHRLGVAQLTAAGIATWKFVPGPGTHSYLASFAGNGSSAPCSSTGCTFPSKSATLPLTVLAPTGPLKTTVGIQASGQQGDYTPARHRCRQRPCAAHRLGRLP